MPTTSPLPSLLDRAPPLPGLALSDLSADERAQGEGTAAHPCGEFSAARFAALYPARYEMIARALAEGFSLDAAARVFRIHERTAAAIREREARSLSAEQYRGVQARHARGVVLAATDLLAERLRRDHDSISTRDLVAAVRELHNVERALEGAPSSVVGVIRADGASAALADLLRQAAAAHDPRPDGFGRGEIPAREAPPPLLAPSAEVVEVVPARGVGATDSHFTQGASACNFNEVAARDTACDTASATDAAPSGEQVGTVPAGSGAPEMGAGGVARDGGALSE